MAGAKTAGTGCREVAKMRKASDQTTGRLKAAAPWVAALSLGIVIGVGAQQKNLGYSDTPFLPGGKWHVHDGNRPQPKMIDPGSASTQEMPGKAPSDATVLFDGKNLDGWKASNGGGAAPWKVENGEMVIAPRTGQIESKEHFGDCQLHIEFSTPTGATGEGQARSNSGVFMLGKYEIQVMDSYNNPTYPDGQAAAVYGQYPPLVNASRKPGQWQMYDILWKSPRFGADGKVAEPATVTILHNGVAVQNAVRVLGPVQHRALASYSAPHPPTGPIALQDHGNPVRFRNIWVRELKDYD